MSYVAIWLQACMHWRCAYFQTLSWNDTIFVVDWDILYKLCGSANKWSQGFVFTGKIWWQFFSCNKACWKYHTHSTTTPKYTLTQRLVLRLKRKLRACGMAIIWQTNSCVLQNNLGIGGTDQGEKMQQRLKGNIPVFWPRVWGTSSRFIELLELQWFSVANWGKLLKSKNFLSGWIHWKLTFITYFL